MISTIKAKRPAKTSASATRMKGVSKEGMETKPRSVRGSSVQNSPEPKIEVVSDITPELLTRAQRLHSMTIEFVPNRDFNQLSAPERWSLDSLDWKRLLVSPRKRSELAEETDVSRLCETHLLTADEEVVLFKRMNELKFGATVLRERLRPENPTRSLVERIESMLDQAQAIRNHIVQANVRLVVAIVKRLTGPQHDFDEFVSDGMLSLMQVVEKFDFDRGFRFSTYAYRALTRTVYRKMASVHKQEQRAGNGMDETLLEVPGRTEASYSEGTWKNLRSLLCEFMQHLDRRERHIIYARYALGFGAKAATFQALADELGVSKERVRQLERRAMDKLQALAGNVDLDQFVEAARIQ